MGKKPGKTGRPKKATRKPTKPSTGKRPWIFWSLFGALVGLFAFRQITDVDVWWHMHLGRSVLQNLSLPDVSTFYWSPVVESRPIDLYFTFLGDTAFYLAHMMFGPAGLQLMLAACLVVSCILLFRFGRDWNHGAMLLLTCLFLGGTYQLQIVRNALFGLPAMMMLLYIWWQVVERDRWRWVWALPVSLGLWRTVHGSYLLGFGVLTLLWVGWMLDLLSARRRAQPKHFGWMAAAFFLSFACIAVFNPMTLTTLGRFGRTIGELWRPLLLLSVGILGLFGVFAAFRRRHDSAFDTRRWTYRFAIGCLVISGGLFAGRHLSPFFEDAALENMTLRLESEAQTAGQLGLPARVKHALNQTVWPGYADQFSSLDFRSPWDYLGDVYVWMTLVLWGWAICQLVRSRRYASHGPLLAFLAVSGLAFGYVRAMGFLAVISAVLIATCDPPRVLRSRSGWTPVLVACFFVATLSDVSGGWLRLGLYRDHILGFGAAPFFPTDCADRVLTEYGDHRVLTTVENGGFLLFRWQGKKPVFIDGFFAPHRGDLLNDYNDARQAGDPNPIADTYGSRVAIVGLRDEEWMQAMLGSPDWSPVYLDRGSMVFKRFDDADSLPPFEILVDVTVLVRLPRYLQMLWGKSLIDVLKCWRQAGHDQRVGEVSTTYNAHLRFAQRLFADLP